MKTVKIISFISLFLILTAFNNTGNIQTQNYAGCSRALLVDDVTYDFNYLTDGNGWNYGAEFHLSNNTSSRLRVKWYFSGSQNAYVQSDGGITDIDPYNTVWIATVTANIPNKAWNSGILHYSWEPI